MVAVGPHRVVPVTFNPAPLRREDADLLTQLNNQPAQPAAQPPAARQQAQPPVSVNDSQRPLTNAQIQAQLNQFLLDNGAPVRINDAGRDLEQIRAFDNSTREVTKAPPTVVMRNEDYGRISRLLADKRAVELEFEIVGKAIGRPHELQRHRGTPRRQGRRGGHAGRPSRFVARGDWCDRQRHRLCRMLRPCVSSLRSASSRGGRSALRCGAGKSRGCLVRPRTSSSISARSKIRAGLRQALGMLQRWIPGLVASAA